MIPLMHQQHPLFPTEVPSIQTPLAIPIPEKMSYTEQPIQVSGKKKKKPQQTLKINDRVQAMLDALYYGRYYTVSQLHAQFWHTPDGSLPEWMRAAQHK